MSRVSDIFITNTSLHTNQSIKSLYNNKLRNLEKPILLQTRYITYFPICIAANGWYSILTNLVRNTRILSRVRIIGVNRLFQHFTRGIMGNNHWQQKTNLHFVCTRDIPAMSVCLKYLSIEKGIGVHCGVSFIVWSHSVTNAKCNNSAC